MVDGGPRYLGPTTFSEAKKAALQLVTDRNAGIEVPNDTIRWLDLLAAELLEQERELARKREWPIELMGGKQRPPKTNAVHSPDIKRNILDVEIGFANAPTPIPTLLATITRSKATVIRSCPVRVLINRDW